MIINGTISFPLREDGGYNIPLAMFAKASLLPFGKGMLFIKRGDEIIDIQIETKIKLFGIKLFRKRY